LIGLGRAEWLRFTYERTPDDGYTLIGSVRRGPRMGALAVDAQGQYVQVNGDHISPLNTSQLRIAVERANSKQAPMRPAPRPSTAPAPVVIVKRRRIVGR